MNLTEGQRKERYLNRMIPELHPGVFPKNDVDHVEMEVTYRERITRQNCEEYRWRDSVRRKSCFRFRKSRNILLRFL